MMRRDASPHQDISLHQRCLGAGKYAILVMALCLASGIDATQHHRTPCGRGAHRDFQGLRSL
jgi:hypothetical protein